MRGLDPDRIQVVDFSQPADVYLVNSCAVTRAAERDVRKAIHRARRRGGERTRVLLTGCMVGASPGALLRERGIWKIIPSWERDRIPEVLYRLREELSTAMVEHEHEDEHMAGLDWRAQETPALPRKARPNLRIQDGCEQRCAYCAVPAGRGPEQSTPPEEVLARLGTLASEGAREVVVSGINLGRWGHDLRDRKSVV